MKQANACDARRARRNTGRGVFAGDPAQREDRDRRRCSARLGQPVESLTFEMLFTAKPFFKHRRKEDRVRMVPPRAFHFNEAVAGDAHRRRGAGLPRHTTRGPRPGLIPGGAAVDGPRGLEFESQSLRVS